MFPGEEDSVWELDERTGQYYLHSFYRHQPDLNIANPAVRDEIAKTIGFWLELGVSGFRVDAVPFLIEPPDGVDIGDPHEFLRDIRRFLQRRSSEAILLGEVNLPVRPAARVLRPHGRPARAHHAVRLPRHAGALPLARPRGRAAARRVAREAPRARARGAVGELRAQPRRAHARQAQRRRARGGVRRVRARGVDARLRPRDRAAAADDARRRPPPHPHGLQPAVLAARHARAVLRRGDRHGREPRRRRAGRPCARPCSGPTSANGGFSRADAVAGSSRRRRPTATRPSTSTSRRRCTTPTRCSRFDPAASRCGTAARPRSAGARFELLADRPGRRARPPAHRRRRAASSPCTTSRRRPPS